MTALPPRRLRLLAACAALVLGGCAADLGAEGIDGDGGAHDGPAACGVGLTLTTRSPTPGTTIAAEAHALAGNGPFTFTWRVTTASGAEVATTPRTSDGAQVDIPIDQPGSYHVTVVQTTGAGGRCSAEDGVTAKNPTGRNDQVLLRFVPPAGSGLQIQQRVIPITGGTPEGDLNITLEQGIPLDLPVRGAGAGDTAPSFVRLIAHDRGFEAAAYVPAGGTLHAVLLDDSYDVLVIPDETAAPRFAPLLLGDRGLASLTGLDRLPLEPGVLVQGTVHDAGGAPLAGARVVLAHERLPSTIGVADLDGTFAVRAQPGDFGVSVAAPPASGMPDLELPAGLNVTADAEVLVAYAPEAAAAGDLDALVTGAAGAVPGARVTVRALLPVAGTVTAGGATLLAPGVVRRLVAADGTGRVRLPALPAGTYDLTIEPLTHGDPNDAVTRLTVAVPGAPALLPLHPKVTLSGTLGGPPGVAPFDLTGTRVTALLHGAAGLAAAPAAAADGSGAFRVRIDPADPASPATYVVVADPPATSGLARGLALVSVASLGDVALTTVALPRALILAGTVRPEFGTPLAGVYVEATRYREPGREDPGVRAEAISDGLGRFTLRFCDPDDMAD